EMECGGHRTYDFNFRVLEDGRGKLRRFPGFAVEPQGWGGSAAERGKYILRIHLTFNVPGYWDEFAVAIRVPWCQGLGHGSPSLTASSALSSTLVRRRHYRHVCALLFAFLTQLPGPGRTGPRTRRLRRPEH